MPAASRKHVQPTPAQALVRTLIEERRRIDGKAQDLAEKLVDEEEAAQRLETQKKDDKRSSDPAPLQEQFRALSPVLRKIENYKQQETHAQALERSLGEAAKRLTPNVQDVDALATAKLPSEETVARCRKGLDDLDRRLDLEHGRAADAVQSMAKAQTLLNKALGGRPVPSLDAIFAERLQRDSSWVPLRATLLGGSEVLTGPALGTAVSALERHTAQADRLADEALSERDRVAQYTARQLQLAETEEKAAEANAAVTTLQTERQTQLAAWLALSEVAGITPLQPAEMLAWLDGVHRMLQRREELQSLRSSVLATAKEIESITPALQQLIQDTGLKPPAPLHQAATVPP